MILNNTNFPILSTKRIVVSKGFESIAGETTETEASTLREFKKVKVEFLVKSREPSSLSRWSSEAFSNIAQYLKIHFIVLDDSSADLASQLYEPETRLASLRAISTLRALGREINADAGTITFDEVLQNEFITSVPVRGHSELYSHDIYSELEIELKEVDLNQTDKVHLIGFMHMDVNSYFSDMGLPVDPNNPDPMEAKGSQLIYDLLLERKESKLEIPYFRNALFIEQPVEAEDFFGNLTTTTRLQPYYGPAHYHPQDNPGPGNYIGWMAGHPSGPMGPTLESREVINYKVVSDIFDLDVDFKPIISVERLQSNSAFGESLEEFVRATVDRDELLDSALKIKKLVNASDLAEAKKSNNFIKVSDIPMSFINSNSEQDPNSGGFTNENSYHASVLGIDYYRLIRDHSSYGDILNFHYEMGNHKFVERALLNSRIINLNVLRERVTNNQYRTNRTSTSEFVTYDKDEPKTFLVSTFQERYERLKTLKTQLAKISEIKLVSMLPNGEGFTEDLAHSRFFVVQDYDLFHNVQAGKHRHLFSFSIDDGVRGYIDNLASAINNVSILFKDYVDEASSPVIKDEQGVYQTGNYDYKMNTFAENFKQKDFSVLLNGTVDIYVESVTFLTGKEISFDRREQILNLLSPLSTNPIILYKFLNTLDIMLNSVRDILKQSGDNFENLNFIKRKETNVSSNGSALKSRIIEVEVKSTQVIDAIPDAALLSDYSNFVDEEKGTTIDTPNLGLQNYLNSLPNLNVSNGRVSNSSILPAAYFSFNSSPFSIKELKYSENKTNSDLDKDNKKLAFFAKKSKSTILSSFNKFNESSGNKKNNEILKLNLMRSQEAVDFGFVTKPESSLFDISGLSSGVSLKNVASSSTVVVDKSFNSSGKEKVDARKKSENENCLELPQDVKETIQSAALNGASREEVIKMVENNYSELNLTIKTLGNIYDSAVKILGSLQASVGQISTTTISRPSEEDKFKENKNSKISRKNFGLLEVLPYIQETAEFRVINSNGDSVKTTISKLLIALQASNIEKESYVFLKIVPIKSKSDAIVPVNNGYLLRV